MPKVPIECLIRVTDGQLRVRPTINTDSAGQGHVSSPASSVHESKCPTHDPTMHPLQRSYMHPLQRRAPSPPTGQRVPVQTPAASASIDAQASNIIRSEGRGGDNEKRQETEGVIAGKTLGQHTDVVVVPHKIAEITDAEFVRTRIYPGGAGTLRNDKEGEFQEEVQACCVIAVDDQKKHVLLSFGLTGSRKGTLKGVGDIVPFDCERVRAFALSTFMLETGYDIRDANLVRRGTFSLNTLAGAPPEDNGGKRTTDRVSVSVYHVLRSNLRGALVQPSAAFLQWYDIPALPYKQMPPHYGEWLPTVLQGGSFTGMVTMANPSTMLLHKICTRSTPGGPNSANAMLPGPRVEPVRDLTVPYTTVEVYVGFARRRSYARMCNVDALFGSVNHATFSY